MKRIGVLSFHGDVLEHINTTLQAAKNLKLKVEVSPVRTLSDLTSLDGLIIPGGESTTLYKLCLRENMFTQMKKIKAIFGTCAGAIMLAKHIQNKSEGQKTLELMDIEIDRNAYGAQTDSFEKKIKTTLGTIQAVFIRAPRIKNVGTNVIILAKNGEEIIACEETQGKNYYLAACFHPELTTTIFHEHFLYKLSKLTNWS